MRLPFFRASKPAAQPTPPARGKAGSASTGTGRDALGVPGEGPLQGARTAARRRLMGAAVLLAVGVIGFPILFETKPRPLPVDLPILLPDGTGRQVAAGASAPALPKPPPDAGLESGPTETTAAAPAPAMTQPPSVPTRTAAPASPASAGLPAKPAIGASAPARVATAADKPAVPANRAPEPAASKPLAVPVAAAKPPPAASEAAATGGGRFVVQVGAYNDPERLRAARQKLEKLGLKSYTQDVDTATGKRTRVRVGPFPTRKEADTVAAKVKASGMQANILAL